MRRTSFFYLLSEDTHLGCLKTLCHHKNKQCLIMKIIQRKVEAKDGERMDADSIG